MNKNILLFLVGFLIFLSDISAQENHPYDGVNTKEYNKYFIVDANIQINPSTLLENANLLIEKGRIIAVGKNIKAPKDAITIDLHGNHYIYPGFIDLFSNYGMPEPQSDGVKHSKQPQLLSDKKGAYSWNEALKTEFSSSKNFVIDTKLREKLLSCGFTTVLTQRMDGLSRGSASLIQLTKSEHNAYLLSDCAHAMSFSKGKSSQSYPRSLMGAIALLEQSHYDALWNEKQEHKDMSLEAWTHLKNKDIVFQVGNKWEVLNAIDIAKTMKARIIVKTSNDTYQRIELFKEKDVRLILPLDFPKAFKFEDEFDLMHAQYFSMKHWELAPYNAFTLAKNEIPFVLTSFDNKDESSFFKNLRIVVGNQLSEENALKALTTTPAKWMKVENELGTISQGKLANFFISSGNIFEKGSKVLQSFINGVPENTDFDFDELKPGYYSLQVGDVSKEFSLTEAKNKWSWMNLMDSSKVEIKSIQSNKIAFDMSWPDSSITMKFIGTYSSQKISGLAYDMDGFPILWDAKFKQSFDQKKDIPVEKKEIEFSPEDRVVYPFQAYGTHSFDNKPANLVIRNAMVWTNEKVGNQVMDVWIKEGKIKEMGSRLDAFGASVIDAQGKHLTSGIIDEHSHIAIRRGVNEGTQSSSAEVKISDVINPDDVNIYRHLAGGVTAVQQLHGSANPIGGQSSLIKLRWGKSAEEMKIKGSDGFIKFALGENVKHSNRSNYNSIRYPQTRMGVEQIFVDYFTKAKEYGLRKKNGTLERTDLEMECLSEILDKKRFISCHSYQQGEINMLMKLAERFDFRINTFTHILEGYKVADKMFEHGVGASTFSDWWAYKYEVIDAIPYNAAILHKMGVLTAINSDDAEMGRRLNQEAAKVIKYGGISEEDAWKMVTLNPAKLLHLEDRMGSIKVGKDADIVLWSSNPLSSYSLVEKTFVDGVLYYDKNTSKLLDKEIREEKIRLATKMTASKGEKKAVNKEEEKHYHCDDVEDELIDKEYNR